MQKRLAAVLISLLLAAPPLAAQSPAKTGEWTGFITDTHCGEKGANSDHTAGCVRKCMKGGSKAQIWSEAEHKAYDLDSFEKVKALVGIRLTVKGAFDSASNTITVESARKAAPK